MILIDKDIKNMKLVEPTLDKVQCNISYGLEPNGYTLSLSTTFQTPYHRGLILDPMDKERTVKAFKDVETDVFVLKPKSFVLGISKEYLNFPNDVMAKATTKSTYARVGVFANITNIEPGFRGYLVIEIANLGRNSVKIYADYGIAMLTFYKHAEVKGYSGNYQDQTSIKV